jgi:indole-3-glycerol phosphate synthase
MSDFLEQACAAARVRVARAVEERPLAALVREAERLPAPRSLTAALGGEGLAVVAEVKRASPSRGPLAPIPDPAGLAAAYADGGAAAISVLTEPEWFEGTLGDLRAVAGAVPVPVLRKDFIVDAYQLVESAAAGADAILLIVAALEPDVLLALHREARSLDLDVLVEVHDEEELEIALEVEAEVIGINNRNLGDFTVDIERTYELLSDVPAGKIVVSESGFSTREQLDELDRVGVDAVLVGETLMRAPDIEAACRELAGDHGL